MSAIPTQVQLKKKSGILLLHYADGSRHELSAEFLRVHSPSAEVRGHGKGQAVLQTGKRLVGFRNLETVGNYAIRLIFDDGHDSGLYSWEYLYRLCQEHDTLWQQYLEALRQAGARRDPLPADTQVITIEPK
ncbi:MAG: DUF971 domain-containing protein [Pseudomonadales bacterium]|nr:DUF971 domain-containing protein [Pseudomonadales bacterium]